LLQSTDHRHSFIQPMSLKKLWTKLFTRNDKSEEIALHISGATVRHRNPFEDLEVSRNAEELPQEFIEKWIIPFYMNNLSDPNETIIKLFADASTEINSELVTKLLGDFNWRSRITGAFFAAINNYKEMEDTIGRHLLKSEVCYAGSGYCLSLATFATEKSKEYLKSYLNYYLDRKDLWFDQAEAYCALEYLDKNSSNKFYEKWKSFVSDKPYWSLEKSRKHFDDCMLTLERIRQTSV
jgi:Family of unknown function (DUF6000)